MLRDRGLSFVLIAHLAVVAEGGDLLGFDGFFNLRELHIAYFVGLAITLAAADWSLVFPRHSKGETGWMSRAWFSVRKVEPPGPFLTRIGVSIAVTALLLSVALALNIETRLQFVAAVLMVAMLVSVGLLVGRVRLLGRLVGTMAGAESAITESYRLLAQIRDSTEQLGPASRQ